MRVRVHLLHEEHLVLPVALVVAILDGTQGIYSEIPHAKLPRCVEDIPKPLRESLNHDAGGELPDSSYREFKINTRSP